MKELVLHHAPIWMQNAAISFYNWRQTKRRRSGAYGSKLTQLFEAAAWSEPKWRSFQQAELDNFLQFATLHSPWYRPYAGLRLADFPPLTKADLVANFDRIRTMPENKGLVSYTGGTTGASMKVVYDWSDVQIRFAVLDWFRSRYGWRPGARTAWFSGKSLTRDRDVARGIVWRDDWLTHTRFFSTFHINEQNFDAYWKGLVDFEPEFIVGFPSSVGEILSMARERGLNYPGRVKAFFPTAETVLPDHRLLASEILGCTTHDQYASSEGAPFILECPAGGLHMMPFGGVFEVVDENLQPARSGELLVTSFTTHGTPLIRYRIGDRVTLAAPGRGCACSWTFPLVESIDGRPSDFVWSAQAGRINLGNLSNSTKGVSGIVGFQVVQDAPAAIDVLIQATPSFSPEDRAKFVEALRLRVGPQMTINLRTVESLPRERSGKFRFVKNNLTLEQMR